jgi:hypothetical protein
LPRLGIHLAAAALAAAALPGVTGVAAVAGAALVLAWSANLFNFMDGSDGLAATMAVCGFSALAAGAWLGGGPAAPMLALAAACVPLLIVNAPPARMFMGDIGAVPLGFLAALFGLAGWGGGVWPAWFPLLVFLPFIADARRRWPGAASPNGSGRRTARTTTSGCTSWGRAPGTLGHGAVRRNRRRRSPVHDTAWCAAVWPQ